MIDIRHVYIWLKLNGINVKGQKFKQGFTVFSSYSHAISRPPCHCHRRRHRRLHRRRHCHCHRRCHRHPYTYRGQRHAQYCEFFPQYKGCPVGLYMKCYNSWCLASASAALGCRLLQLELVTNYLIFQNSKFSTELLVRCINGMLVLIKYLSVKNMIKI